MRIGVSCRSLEYASGGVRQYLTSLLDALLALDRENTYVLFHSRPAHMGRFPGAREVSLDCANRLAFDWLKLPPALTRHDVDVAFFPASNMPPRVPCKAVATMLDLGYFHTGYRMYRLPDTVYMRWAMAYTARRAQRLLAISEYTKADLMRVLGVPGDRIDVTHLAADARYLSPPQPEAVAAFLRRNALMRPYFLYAGNISPRKNLSTLLEAFSRVRGRVEHDLVVTGGMAWSEDWDRRVAALGLTDRVRRLGHVEEDDMPALYAGALAFVFPSRFEGFGLPVLEAMSLGAPVITSNVSSLPEVAGEAALLVDPMDPAAIAAAMERLERDHGLREALGLAGRSRAALFSWDEAARTALAAYDAALAMPRFARSACENRPSP